jgi:hypothetical protein
MTAESPDWLNTFGQNLANLGTVAATNALNNSKLGPERQQDLKAARDAQAWPVSRTVMVIGGAAVAAFLVFVLLKKR